MPVFTSTSMSRDRTRQACLGILQPLAAPAHTACPLYLQECLAMRGTKVCKLKAGCYSSGETSQLHYRLFKAIDWSVHAGAHCTHFNLLWGKSVTSSGTQFPTESCCEGIGSSSRTRLAPCTFKTCPQPPCIIPCLGLPVLEPA